MSADVVATFMAICECNEDKAIRYLSKANFELDLALSLYASKHDAFNSRTAPTVPQAPSSPPDTSNADSRGHSTAPYLVARLDGGGVGVGNLRGDLRSSAAPMGRQGQQHQRNPIEDETLSLMFSTPPFVETGAIPFERFCAQSLEADRWVLLCIVEDSFKSFCVNRDVWKPDSERELLNMFSIYQANVSSDRGMQLLNGYKVEVEDLPVLLIINPLTTMKEVLVRLPMNSTTDGINIEEVRHALLSFMGDRGSPTQCEEKKQHQSRTTQPAKSTLESKTTLPKPQVHLPEALSATGKQKVVVKSDDATPKVDPVAGPADTCLPQVTAPKPVDISAYELPTETTPVFSLRCRLPKEQVTLRLKPETPATLLLHYLAYRTYMSDPEAFPNGPPQCALRGGYPVKEIDIKPDSQLSALKTVRSGDNVFLYII